MKVKDSNNLKGAIIGNVLTSLSNFLSILLSTSGHNSYEHGFFSLTEHNLSESLDFELISCICSNHLMC